MNKFLIRLTSCFLLKKKKRVAYREQKFKELYQEQRKKYDPEYSQRNLRSR